MSYKIKVKEEKSILASGFIPTEPEEINAQWLFEVINQYREVKNLSLLNKPDDILECEINERLNSRGYLSSTYIINCKFKVFTTMGMEESDYSFFIKMFPSSHIYSNERGKYLVKRTNAFQREIETNFCFLRRLNMFVEETARKTPELSNRDRKPSLHIQTPDIVYGSHDEEGNGVIVWMDATAAHGFQPTNHCKGLTITQLLCVVETLAQFHAASVAFLLINENRVEQEFPFLYRGVEIDKFANEEDFDGGLQNGNEGGNEQERLIQEMMPVFKDFSRFIRKVPGLIDAFKSWERHRPMAPGTLVRSSRRTVKAPLRAIVHGELWEKNILLHRKRLVDSCGNSKRGSGKRKVFQNGHQKNSYQQPSDNSEEDEDDEDEVTRHLLRSDDEDSSFTNNSQVDDNRLPYDVMLTDWKYSGIGSPTDDLAMLLLSSISGNKRQKHTKDILKRYHSSFVTNLKTVYGIDVYKEFPDYNYQQFLKSYELSLIGGFLKTISIMTVEIKNLEADFLYIKDECVEEKDKAGINMRIFGRRLLDIADEFLPKKVNSPEWRKYQMALKSFDIHGKVSSSGKRSSGLRTPSGLRNKNSGHSPSPSPTNQSNSHSSITKATTIKLTNTKNDTTPVSMKLPALRV